MTLAVFLLILFGALVYFTTAEERARVGRIARAYIQKLRSRPGSPASQPFSDALRARTSLVIVTPLIAVLNVVVFTEMIFGVGSLSDPGTLIAWGATFGPRTTHGEWWRLLSMMFVHAGPLHLAATLAGLIPAGLLLERLVGRLAFSIVYLGAGTIAALVSVATSPVAVNDGASGAVCGVYGLLLACVIWGTIDRSVLTIPLAALKNLLPGAALFVLYNVATDRLGGAAELAGLGAGLAGGLVLAWGLGESKPPARRIAGLAAATAILALAVALSMPAIADVMPEIKRVAATENRTADAYNKAVDRFKNGRTTAEGLAVFIDQSIVPELQAEADRLKAIEGVPAEHRPLVADTEEYLRLRHQSWRLRSDALHKASMRTLRQADRMEWESLQVFARIAQSDEK